MIAPITLLCYVLHGKAKKKQKKKTNPKAFSLTRARIEPWTFNMALKDMAYYYVQLLPSNEVNIESCQHEGFSPRENNLSRVDNLMFTSYEGNNCFIIQKLLYDVYDLNDYFCRRQQNNFQYRKYNYGTGFPVVRGCRQDDNLLAPSTLYMFGLYTPGCLPRQQIFRKKHLNCLLTSIYIVVKTYVGYI